MAGVGGGSGISMAAALPPIDFTNEIFIDYSSGKGVVKTMPAENSGTEHDYYLICCATSVRAPPQGHSHVMPSLWSHLLLNNFGCRRRLERVTVVASRWANTCLQQFSNSTRICTGPRPGRRLSRFGWCISLVVELCIRFRIVTRTITRCSIQLTLATWLTNSATASPTGRLTRCTLAQKHRAVQRMSAKMSSIRSVITFLVSAFCIHFLGCRFRKYLMHAKQQARHARPLIHRLRIPT